MSKSRNPEPDEYSKGIASGAGVWEPGSATSRAGTAFARRAPGSPLPVPDAIYCRDDVSRGLACFAHWSAQLSISATVCSTDSRAW